MRPRLLLTINCKFAVDFFARCLHTRTAVARLPLRQLGFIVCGAMCARLTRELNLTFGHGAFYYTMLWLANHEVNLRVEQPALSDLYSTKVLEENQDALRMGARGRDWPTESNRSLNDV